jgi:archaeosortase B (VPXXXP-CTERM-specific)
LSPEDGDRTSSSAGGPPPSPPRLLGRLRAWWAVPTYRFAVVFLGLLTGMAFAYPALRLHFGGAFQAGENFTSRLVYAIVSRISPDASLKEPNLVFLGPYPVAIIDECTGVYEAVLLSAALLAFPTAWSRTLIGLAIGLPLIYAMNLMRIIGLLFVGRYFSRSFEFMHLYFWQVTMIAMVATVWLGWVLWVVRDDAVGRAPADEKKRG